MANLPKFSQVIKEAGLMGDTTPAPVKKPMKPKVPKVVKPKESELSKKIKAFHRGFRKVNRFVSRNLAARSTSYRGR